MLSAFSNLRYLKFILHCSAQVAHIACKWDGRLHTANDAHVQLDMCDLTNESALCSKMSYVYMNH